MFAVYGAVTAVGLLLSFAFTRENVQSVESVIGNGVVEKMRFADGVKNFVKNKYFLFALAMTVIVNFAIQISSGSQTYFYTYVMGNSMLTTSLNLANLVPMVISVMFLAGPCLRRFGKKKSVYIGISGQIVGYLLRTVAAYTMNVPLLAVGTVVCSLFSGPLSVPVNMLTADAVDYGEYLTNKRIEGIGSSVVSFSQKISAGLSAGCVGWILGMTGYVANQVQNAAANFGIIFMFTWFPMILLAITMVAFRFIYKYDEEEEAVLAELERRKHDR